jgi:hypothetical protein
MGLINNRYRAVIVGAIAAYLSVFLIFTNLHILHMYYQVSNAIFVCVAIGISIASIMDKGWHKVAAVMLVCILISQAQFFREFFWRYIQYDNVGDPMILTAQAARDAMRACCFLARISLQSSHSTARGSHLALYLGRAPLYSTR